MTIPKRITEPGCALGEGPLWHADQQKLWFTNITGRELYRHDPAADRTERFSLDRMVGGFTFQADGSLLLFLDGPAIAVWRDGKVEKFIVEAIAGEEGRRFNDVIADPEGRVFCGTLGAGGGNLYRLDRDGTLTKVVENVGCANGMGFSLDFKTMYFTDSPKFVIWAFDYDRSTGAITNQRPFINTDPKGGYPDGMTVDAAGNVWSAKWDGWGVEQYSPTGQLLQKIKVDSAKKVSSVAFGGADYAKMYLTTAGGDKLEENGPGAGACFVVDPGVKGLAEHYSRIGI